MKVSLPNQFTPRKYQSKAMGFFDAGGKRAITVWHRRAGKDLTAAHQTCKRAHEEVNMYWHFFPTFEQARRAIWEGYTKDGKRILENVFPGFLDEKRPGSIVARKNESQMFVELKCGSIWRLMGTDRIESVGAGPKGVVFSEYALCRPNAWDFVRPMLRENGGWAWFITTPRGNNHAKKLYDSASVESGWYRDIQTVYDTGLTYASSKGTRLLSPQEMLDEERSEGMPEALIQQEYLCDFTSALLGSVYGDVMQALEKRGGLEFFAHDVDDVFTNWDLGVDDSTAIWFWRLSGNGVDFIDHLEAHGKPMSFYFDMLDARSKSQGYKYKKHWLPHDAKARTLQTGESILEQCIRRWGSGAVAIGPQLSLLDGIQASRWLLQQEGTRIHPRCSEIADPLDCDGVECLKQYHWGFDDEKRVFSKKPVHDWSSHTADAFRYAACVARVSELLTRKEEVKQKPAAVPLAQAFTLDELFEDNETRSWRERH